MNTSKIRVFVITPWYPYRLAPTSGIFIKELTKALPVQVNAIVIHPVLDPNIFYRLIVENSVPKVYHVAYGGVLARKWIYLRDKSNDTKLSVLERLQRKLLSVFLFHVLFYAFLLHASLKVIKKEGTPHLFHAHVYKVAFPVLMLSKLLSIPSIMTEHASNFLSLEVSFIDRLCSVPSMKYFAKILPVSDFLREGLLVWGVPNKKMYVVPNVINDRFFFNDGKDKNQSILTPLNQKNGLVRIATITNFNRVKGLTFLLEALRLLKQEQRREPYRESFPEFCVEIIGGGELRQYYEKLARELGLDDMITFTGPLSHEHVGNKLRKCDFFVFPSLHETFGISLVEALACGKPVITTPVGVATTVVNERTGLFVRPRDVQGLKDAIKWMLLHHTEYDSEEIARSVASEFYPAAVKRQLWKVYREVITQKSELTLKKGVGRH